MKESLTKIRVENFKSLKDFEISLNQFNVLIGPNGSGKTNVLESLKLAILCISPQKIPAYPFADWGGYKNLIWSGNDEKFISFEIGYIIGGYDVTYTSVIAGLNNTRLEIHEEGLRISNSLDAEFAMDKVDYKVHPSLIPVVGRICDDLRRDSRYKNALPNFEEHFTIPHRDSNVSFLKSVIVKPLPPKTKDLTLLRLVRFDGDQLEQHMLPSPSVTDDHGSHSLYAKAVSYLTDPSNIVILRQLDYDYLRSSTPINYPEGLEEDGGGLINLLFHWFTNDQKLPESFELAFEALFPGWQIRFHVTPGSDITLRVFDGMTELSPPSIPDGFYKLLVILAAVELNPKILLIDELENSLHGRIIEYVIGLLKSIDSTVIISTHSPFVVDSVDVDDLVLVEREDYKTTCRRVGNPAKLREELADKGVTVSESWLYSEML